MRRQAATGVDYIKLYVGLKPDLVEAAIDSLVQNQIPVDPTLGIYKAIFKQGFPDPQNEQ